jgi:hypothetical protein
MRKNPGSEDVITLVQQEGQVGGIGEALLMHKSAYSGLKMQSITFRKTRYNKARRLESRNARLYCLTSSTQR